MTTRQIFILLHNIQISKKFTAQEQQKLVIYIHQPILLVQEII